MMHGEHVHRCMRLELEGFTVRIERYVRELFDTTYYDGMLDYSSVQI